MTIIRNELCPECAKTGHDKSSNHLIIFSDQGGYCNRGHLHESGKPYYRAAKDAVPLSELPITGEIQYSPEQFRELERDGKLIDPKLRAIAMGGMRMKARYAVMSEEERTKQDEEWALDCEWFEKLKVKSLVDRGIHGLIAKLFDVRVGHSDGGAINRHYYPVHNRKTLKLQGAKSRTLPKDFRFGHLGKRFGDTALFGMHTMQRVMDSGTFRRKLLIVGGECDAMAAQQMLVKSLNKLESLQGLTSLDSKRLAHVWSPTKGETCLEEVIANREYIDQFEEIIWGFDADDIGNKLNLDCARLFKSKSKFLVYPSGCKDANDCLKQGHDRAFVDSWWNPAEARIKGKLKTVSAYREQASRIMKMGLDYFEPALNPVTFGVQLRHLGVWGAGTGVGKTEITSQHVASLLKQGQTVVAIYLENSPDEVVKTFAGMLANKDFMSPPLMAGESFNPMRDYTQEDLDAAIEALENSGQLLIPDLGGSKDVNVIMEVLDDAMALGYQYFVVDNLTAFEHHVDGKVQTGVTAIDETMKRIGTFKDEHDVNIMLLTHLTRPDKQRVPHELGGEVYITDFRGAGSISFWANSAWGIERNSQADSLADKCTTLIRNLKSRGVGHKVGSVVVMQKDITTGKFTHVEGAYELPQVGREKKERQHKPTPATPFMETEEREF
ncbi:DNA helicase [Aeromonas phage vB_AspA_Tola]|nr:DNA helicase [Aeromonas phage vB_AspA_Tola]